MMKLKLNKTQTDNALTVISAPFVVCFVTIMSILFLIFFTFRLSTFLYGVMVTPLLILLEKFGENYQRVEIPDLWAECFDGAIKDWNLIMNIVANC